MLRCSTVWHLGAFDEACFAYLAWLVLLYYCPLLLCQVPASEIKQRIGTTDWQKKKIQKFHQFIHLEILYKCALLS